MKLRGIEFGDAVWAPGTFGFLGERRKLWSVLVASKAAFATAPITAFPFESQKSSSDASVSEIGAGMVCTSMDASNIGLEKLLNSGKLQQRKNSFFVSIRFLGNTVGERLMEAERIRDIFVQTPKNFRSQFGLIVSFFEPNDGEYDALVIETKEICEILSEIGIPLVVEISMFFPPDVVQQIVSISECDALMIRSSMLWSQMSAEAHHVFFRTKKLPVSGADDALVYGKYMLPLSLEWIRQAKKYAGHMPIYLGGGILNAQGVQECMRAGANGVVLDRAIFLRFWNIRSIVSRIQTYRTNK